MIEVIKINGGIPVSVIVPLQEKRKEFFYSFVLPMLMANNPYEIIINDNDGNAAKKRNEGFQSSSCPFVFPCDDDIVLPKNYLQKLYDSIKEDSTVGYVYTGYTAIVLYPKTHPNKENYKAPTQDFNGDDLRQGNYISSMSLMKREIYPSFDESLPQYDDYDMYLRLLDKGVFGKACHGIEFLAFYIDEGITSVNNKFDLPKKPRLRRRH